MTVLILLVAPLLSEANIKLPHLIASHMVLQQKSQCPLWGWGEPGEKVTIKGSWGAEATATTNDNGKWETSITTPSYGGPYTMSFSGKNTITISDVMIGEVWLASGQSNMEITMEGWPPDDTVKGAYQAILNSTNPNIRYHNIQQKASFYDMEDANGWWNPMDTKTTKFCSAIAYFFAKKIYDETKIPIGIINASWGGSDAESWIELDYLKNVSSLKERIAQYEQSVPLQKKLTDWIKSHHKLQYTNQWKKYETMIFNDEEIAKINYDDSKWPVIRIPSYIDNPEYIGAYDGMIWFRNTVTIPEEWVGKKLMLSLGPIDDMDVVYINGEKIGENFKAAQWNVNRTYEIQPGLVRAGDMVIAIRLIDTGNSGGIYGSPNQLKIYPEGMENDTENAIYIAGHWKYLPTGEFVDEELYQYDHKTLEYFNRPQVDVTLSPKTLASTYRGMIKPLIPFRIAGVIWYQGESNVRRSAEYMELLPLMVKNWRDKFQNQDIKFYYCQLAPFDYSDGSPSYELREAQRRCMKLIPSSGMAVLLDAGKKESLHPAYKQEAGERLALWALNDVYGKSCETSGPIYESMIIANGHIELTFSHIGKGLVAKGGKLTDFEISDSRGNFHPANAVISGDKIIVSSPDVTSPKNVRYCWKNYVNKVSLYNADGLPASSFSTEKKFIAKKQILQQ